ncbi:hypothetical protein BDN67DRAFT_693413 [Paxillus ammoniavirescens]|nr:hypothetical protein BDN67DRAFT_693413 [Paxillus ammoniavirescens]
MSEINRGTLSSQRLVWCDCNTCKQQNPNENGKYIPAYLRDNHRQDQILGQTAIAQRGRGSAGRLSSRALAPVVQQRGRVAPRGALSAAPIPSITRTRGGPIPNPSTSRTNMPQAQYPNPTTSPAAGASLHQPAQPLQSDTVGAISRASSPPSTYDYELMDVDHDYNIQPSTNTITPPLVTPPTSASESTPVLPSQYVRVIQPTHETPLLSTRTTPIPLAAGIPIPLAQSRPTLVPRQTPPPARSARPRKKAKIRAAPIEREDEEATRDSLRAERAPGDALGLYDDPDAGDDIHNNPLLHTQLNEEETNLQGSPRPHSISAGIQRAKEVLVETETPLEYPAPSEPSEVYHNVHAEWFGRVIILLVAILHSKHHVSFRACALILYCISAILVTLGVLHPTQPLPLTLNTVIHRLDLHDRFTVYPVCGQCHRIFPTNTSTSALCPDCDTRLFRPVSDRIFRMITGRKPQRPPPLCAAPIQLPSSLLMDFLARSNNETACESWKTRTTKTGELNDISDGEVWCTSQGPDQRPFFSRTEHPEELRIGVTMSLDWFGRKTSVYGPSHSSGVMSLCVSNLPRALRYRAENLLVSFMTPGPSEPTAAQLQNYMKIIVDDLLTLYDKGIIYHTPQHPEEFASYYLV